VRFLISGYYGFGNAGDELILRVIKTRIAASGSRLTALSENPAETSKLHGIEAVDRWNLPRVIKSLINCDRFISGGGGLFQDRTGSLSLYYYLGLIFLAKALGRKTFICGAGVDEMSWLNGRLTAAVFSLAERVSVRDEASRDLLIGWGLKQGKVEAAADIAFLEDVTIPSPSRAGRQPVIGIILRKSKNVDSSSVPAAALARSLVQKLGARVLFIPFQLPADLEINRKAAGNSELCTRDGIEGLIEELGRCDLVLSQRYHGLVLAALLGIPFAGIYTDEKIDRFLSLTGQTNYIGLFNSCDPGLVDLLNGLIRSKPEIAAKLEPVMAVLKAKAERNFIRLYN
jgi:polysaccharide pyruvyl transferase CsaB